MKNKVIVLPKCCFYSLVLALLVMSQPTRALIITDTFIAADGREWAQANLFNPVTWNTINGQCPGGVCTAESMLNGWDLDGWTWASVQDVQLLFNAYTGDANTAKHNTREANSAWAPLFLSQMLPTVSYSSVAEVLAWTSTSAASYYGNPAYTSAFLAQIVNYTSPTIDDLIEIAQYPKGTNYAKLGSFFFRDIPTGEVPIPSAVWLFGSGLLGLVGMARRRKA